MTNDPEKIVARMHHDGRVIPEATYATAARDGGASWSSVRDYTIKLVPLAAPVGEAVAQWRSRQGAGWSGWWDGTLEPEFMSQPAWQYEARILYTAPQPTAAAPEAKPRNLYSEGYYQGRADAAAAPDVLAMREALQQVVEFERQCPDAWLRKAIALLTTALSAQGEAKPEPRAAESGPNAWGERITFIRAGGHYLSAWEAWQARGALSIATPEPQEWRSIQDLQREIGQLQQELVLRVCGDPTKGIGFNTVTGVITQDGERDHG